MLPLLLFLCNGGMVLVQAGAPHQAPAAVSVPSAGASAVPPAQRATLPELLPQDTQDAGDHYLLEGGRRLPLLRARREVALFCRVDTAGARARWRGRLDAELLCVQPHAGGALAVVRLAGETGRDAWHALRAGPEVAWAFPVLVSPQSGRRVIPTDHVLFRPAGPPGAAEVAEALKAAGLSHAEEVPGLAGLEIYRARLTDPVRRDPLAAAHALSRSGRVRWAEPDFLTQITAHFLPNDPLFAQQQSLRNTAQNGAITNADVSAATAWDITRGRAEIIVAVLDDGVDFVHQDLWGRFAAGGTNVVGGNVDYLPVGNDGHGTACAGIIAANANNLLGVAGIAHQCRLLPVKIQEGGQFVLSGKIAEALAYAAAHADILSCSWGMLESSAVSDVLQVIAQLGRQGKGAPVFFGSGNRGSRWSYQGLRFAIPFSVFGQPAGNYRVAFSYVQGPPFAAENAVWMDEVCLLMPDRYTIRQRETFESATFPPPGWSLPGPPGTAWIRTTTNAFRGTGGSASARSRPGLATGAVSSLLSPLWTVAPQDWLVFSYATDFGSGSAFELTLVSEIGQGLRTVRVPARDILQEFVIGGAVDFPARHPATIAVGAATDHDRRADYSQWGPELDLLAPSSGGVNDVIALDPVGAIGGTTNDYNSAFGGTSAATALAAGVAALMLSVNPDLTAAEVRQLMRAACDKVGGVTYDVNGFHPEYGHGRLNARRAVENARVDLGLTQMFAPTNPVAGLLLTNRITLSNVGPATARGITVTNQLPAGVSFVSASTPTGDCLLIADRLICSIPALASNQAAFITLVVQPQTAGVIAFTATAASTVLDANPADNTQTLSVTVQAPQPPSLTFQPQPQVAVAGSNAVFAAGVSGSEPLHYQWFFNQMPLAGQTSPALNLEDIQAGHAGFYHLVVSNAQGAVTSAQARLLVSATVFDNLLNRRGFFHPDPGAREHGDQITLAGAFRIVHRFEFEYFASLTAAPGKIVRVRLRENDGPLAGGFASPGVAIFESQALPLANGRRREVLDNLFVAVPDVFTWTVQFSGLEPGEQAGLEIYDPPAAGGSADALWERDDTGVWQLRVAPFGGGLAANFAARVAAYSTPRPVWAAPVWRPEGALELRLRGDAGLIYGIDTSAGLAGWSRWQTRTNLTGEIQLMETGPHAAPHRFYRAFIEPPQP